MKKSQYFHKITLYKINTFEPNITNKKCLSYKPIDIYTDCMECKYLMN